MTAHHPSSSLVVKEYAANQLLLQALKGTNLITNAATRCLLLEQHVAKRVQVPDTPRRRAAPAPGVAAASDLRRRGGRFPSSWTAGGEGWRAGGLSEGREVADGDPARAKAEKPHLSS